MENKALVDFIKKTYCYYRQKYVMMTSEYTKTVDHYFTEKVIESHLMGYYALGVFGGEKVTKFISVDIDEGGKKTVRLVLDTFERMGIPRNRQYVSTSGRKGYHVDIFFQPYLYNEKAKNLYDLMMWQTGLNPKKVEFRPTNKQAVKVPLGIHAKTRNRCWYLDQTTLQPIERMDYMLEIMPIASTDVLEIIRAWNKKRWNELYADMICNDTGHDNSIQAKDEPVFDTEYYERHAIVEPGTRHTTMVKIACDLRHYGANHFQIEKALKGFYYKQDMCMINTPEAEVLDDIVAIAAWAEEYVPIYKQRQPVGRDAKPVTFTKDDINYILMGPTSAARKVAFLLWSYCKIFGASHMSYATIAETVGVSTATAKTAVAKLYKSHIISRKSGGCHFRNGIMVREANTYFMPQDRELACPAPEELVGESYSFTEKITAENIETLYLAMLTGICRIEYLAKFLTGPEVEACGVLSRDVGCVSDNGDPAADADGGSAGELAEERPA